MDFIKLPSHDSNFVTSSVLGTSMPQLDPRITEYTITVSPLENARAIAFEDIWSRLDNSALLNGHSQSGRSQAQRDVQRLCKMGH